jgi:hypothetical protein
MLLSDFALTAASMSVTVPSESCGMPRLDSVALSGITKLETHRAGTERAVRRERPLLGSVELLDSMARSG